MQNIVTFYIIPSNVCYVQNPKEIQTWEKTDKIDPNVPTVIFFNESIFTHYARFIVTYKNKMQSQGGSGSCYNPCKRTFIHDNDPMDNTLIPHHMSKWSTFDVNSIFKMAISIKYHLLEKMGMGDKLPFWYWEAEYYDTIPGILLGKLDLVGMGKLHPSEILSVKKNKTLLLK